MDASIRGLEREGWRVLPAPGVQGVPGNSGPRLIAGNGTHAFRVLVVLPEEIDTPGTRAQISNSAKRGETDEALARALGAPSAEDPRAVAASAIPSRTGRTLRRAGRDR